MNDADRLREQIGGLEEKSERLQARVNELEEGIKEHKKAGERSYLYDSDLNLWALIGNEGMGNG